jgi:DNA-binding IclR family transcriptional regulator
MVKQDSSGNYDLGPAALSLGLSALGRVDMLSIADIEIAEFCEESGSTVLVAALGPSGPIIIRWHAGRPPIVTSLAVGSHLSLIRSATGQVFLAFRSNNETCGLVEKEQARSPDMEAVDIDRLKASIRRQGHAIVGGTVIPGLNATAFPIFDPQGQAMLAASLLGTAQTPARIYKKSAAELEQICVRVSAIAGRKEESG